MRLVNTKQTQTQNLQQQQQQKIYNTALIYGSRKYGPCPKKSLEILKCGGGASRACLKGKLNL